MDLLEKYEKEVLTTLDTNNVKKIVEFLKKQDCDYIDELLNDYLDLFDFEYNDFVERFNKLNEKYNFNYIKDARSNMDLLEEFYMI